MCIYSHTTSYFELTNGGCFRERFMYTFVPFLIRGDIVPLMEGIEFLYGTLILG